MQSKVKYRSGIAFYPLSWIKTTVLLLPGCIIVELKRRNKDVGVVNMIGRHLIPVKLCN